MKQRISLVEDDFALAMGTEYALRAEGYEVVYVSNLDCTRQNPLTVGRNAARWFGIFYGCTLWFHICWNEKYETKSSK